MMRDFPNISISLSVVPTTGWGHLLVRYRNGRASTHGPERRLQRFPSTKPHKSISVYGDLPMRYIVIDSVADLGDGVT